MVRHLTRHQRRKPKQQKPKQHLNKRQQKKVQPKHLSLIHIYGFDVTDGVDGAVHMYHVGTVSYTHLNGAVIKTIVSTEMIRPMCEAYGVELMDVLTGFKFIGEKIKGFEETGSHSYIFGFEESYGCLAGTYEMCIRDRCKDEYYSLSDSPGFEQFRRLRSAGIRL